MQKAAHFIGKIEGVPKTVCFYYWECPLHSKTKARPDSRLWCSNGTSTCTSAHIGNVWEGRNVGRHENVPHIRACFCVCLEGGVENLPNTTNVPKWARSWCSGGINVARHGNTSQCGMHFCVWLEGEVGGEPAKHKKCALWG